MRIQYSLRPRIRREQKEFVARCFAHLPESVVVKIRSLPLRVVFKTKEGLRGKGVYDHETRTIHLPQSYWKDQEGLAKWIRELNESTFLHENGHAFDFLGLTVEQRDSLLLPLTGHETNGHSIAWEVVVPKATDDNGVLLADWMHRDWGQSAAELFADTFVAAFTSLPPHDRAPEALQITPRGIVAIKEALP